MSFTTNTIKPAPHIDCLPVDRTKSVHNHNSITNQMIGSCPWHSADSSPPFCRNLLIVLPKPPHSSADSSSQFCRFLLAVLPIPRRSSDESSP